MANEQRNEDVHATLQLNYTKIKLLVASNRKKIHGEKQNNFVISLFIFIKK